jgi:hypothetical protein
MSTVTDLKATLRQYGLPVSGNKAALAMRIDKARQSERSKRVGRAYIVKNNRTLRGELSQADEEMYNKLFNAPGIDIQVVRNDRAKRLDEAQQAVLKRLDKEADAALIASGYEKRAKKDPNLRHQARRRLRKHQIATYVVNEGRRQLAGRLPQFHLRKERGIFKDYRAVVSVGNYLEADALALLTAMAPSVTTVIEDQLRGHGVKFSMVLNVVFEKEKPGSDPPEMIEETAYLRSHAKPVLNPGDIAERLDEAHAEIIENLEKFTNKGSNYRLKRCKMLDLQFAEYRPYRGRSYFKTPAYVPPRSVINVENYDNRCFEWAILSALYPVGSKDHASRISKYTAHLGELNFDGIKFPVEITNIPRFERQNSTLSIAVFAWNGGPYPIYESKNTAKNCREITLLLLTDPNNVKKYALCLDQRPWNTTIWQ